MRGLGFELISYVHVFVWWSLFNLFDLSNYEEPKKYKFWLKEKKTTREKNNKIK